MEDSSSTGDMRSTLQMVGLQTIQWSLHNIQKFNKQGESPCPFSGSLLGKGGDGGTGDGAVGHAATVTRVWGKSGTWLQKGDHAQHV